MPTKSRTKIEHLFALPIYRDQVSCAESINRNLEKLICDNMATCQGISRSNNFGWHSKPDLHTWDDVNIKQLLERTRENATNFLSNISLFNEKIEIEKWQIEAWANVNFSGASNKVHCHDKKGGVIISGFYYVNIGEPESRAWQGNTFFVDRDNFPKHFNFNPNLFTREIENKPKCGEMILFPSWLPHGVREYRGKSKRITIAFNLKHPDIQFTKITDVPSPRWAWHYFPLVMRKIKQFRNQFFAKKEK